MNFDLTKDDSQIVFAQSYRDSCNPIDPRNMNICWLVESYSAGEAGLRGTLSLTVGESISGGYDVYWEGVTDRFEGPSQWHSHETVGRISVSSGQVLEAPR